MRENKVSGASENAEENPYASIDYVEEEGDDLEGDPGSHPMVDRSLSITSIASDIMGELEEDFEPAEAPAPQPFRQRAMSHIEIIKAELSDHSFSESEYLSEKDYGVIWHVQVVADDYNNAKHCTPDGKLKLRCTVLIHVLQY